MLISVKCSKKFLCDINSFTLKPHTKVDRLLITIEVSKVKGFESKQRRDCQVQKIKVQKVMVDFYFHN